MTHTAYCQVDPFVPSIYMTNEPFTVSFPYKILSVSHPTLDFHCLTFKMEFLNLTFLSFPAYSFFFFLFFLDTLFKAIIYRRSKPILTAFFFSQHKFQMASIACFKEIPIILYLQILVLSCCINFTCFRCQQELLLAMKMYGLGIVIITEGLKPWMPPNNNTTNTNNSVTTSILHSYSVMGKMNLGWLHMQSVFSTIHIFVLRGNVQCFAHLGSDIQTFVFCVPWLVPRQHLSTSLNLG